MKNLDLWAGRLPIGRAVELTLVAALLGLLVALGGCAATDAPPGAASAADAPMNAHDASAARAMALQKIGESGDAETKRLAIFALVTMGQGGQAPAPVTVQGPRTVGEAIFGFLDRTLERALNIAPAFLAYKGQVRQSQTTEAVAAINRDVALNQSNNFLALGAAGIGGTQAVGVASVNALAGVASRPVLPTTNISGNTGPVLVGGGNLNSGSLNPINPAPVICFNGTATSAGTCSRGP